MVLGGLKVPSLTTMIFAAGATDFVGIAFILVFIMTALALFRTLPGLRLEESPTEAFRSTAKQREWVDKFWKVEYLSGAAFCVFAVIGGFLTYFAANWAMSVSSPRQPGDLYLALPNAVFVGLIAGFVGFAVGFPASMAATRVFLNREDFSEFIKYLDAKAGYLASRVLIVMTAAILVVATLSMMFACDCFFRITPTTIEWNGFFSRGTTSRPLSSIRSLVEVQPQLGKNGTVVRLAYSRIDFADGSSLKLHPTFWFADSSQQREVLDVLAKATGIEVAAEPFR